MLFFGIQSIAQVIHFFYSHIIVTGNLIIIFYGLSGLFVFFGLTMHDLIRCGGKKQSVSTLAMKTVQLNFNVLSCSGLAPFFSPQPFQFPLHKLRKQQFSSLRSVIFFSPQCMSFIHLLVLFHSAVEVSNVINQICVLYFLYSDSNAGGNSNPSFI